MSLWSWSSVLQVLFALSSLFRGRFFSFTTMPIHISQLFSTILIQMQLCCVWCATLLIISITISIVVSSCFLSMQNWKKTTLPATCWQQVSSILSFSYSQAAKKRPATTEKQCACNKLLCVHHITISINAIIKNSFILLHVKRPTQMLYFLIILQLIHLNK